MKIRPDYGKFLKAKRTEKDLTIEQLSIKTGIPIENLTEIENGNMKKFSLHQLTCYIRALDVLLSEVIS